MRANKILYVLDGTAMAYRAFHGMHRQGLSNSSGMATGAVYGFIRMLEVIGRQAGENPIVAAFDHSGPTFRHEMYKEYKATRERMPEDLRDQMPYIRRVVEAKGIPLLMVPGFEADDIMATLAEWATSQDCSCYLVTSDKDMAQLVGSRVKLMQPPKSGEVTILGSDEVEEKYGVRPSLMRDFLALTGDSSDNIPGVPGIGPKRAAELLLRFGNLEQVLVHSSHVRQDSVRKALQEHSDKARLSLELVSLRFDVPIPLIPELLEPGEADPRVLVNIYTELEFAALAGSIALPREEETERDYQVVKSGEHLALVAEELRAARLFSFDLETTSLDCLVAVPVGIALCSTPGRAYYVPIGEGGLSPDVVWDILGPLLQDPEVSKGGQNSKYDISVLLSQGIEVRGLTFDTMLESYLIDPNLRQRNLDFLALRHLGIKKIPTEALLGKGKSQITMDLVPVDEVVEYACEDADVALRLHHEFEPQLDALAVAKLYSEVEIPLVHVLTSMERNGICLDVEYVRSLGREFGGKLLLLEQKIRDLAGEQFNLNSPQQLSYILFQKLEIHKELGIRRLKKTKTGYSTDVSVLESMSEHPLVAAVMEYRNLAKLKNTYVDALLRLVHPKTGRIHTSFNQAVAATGRLSSSNPNLQNIPIRTEAGRKVRKAFTAAPGCVLLAADYSQIELRILAHLSEDEGLTRAFAAGEDIHRQTASKVFDVPPDQVSQELRSRAKAINFGLLYGMGPRRLAKETGITVQEAVGFIERYFQRFPGVKNFAEVTVQRARAEGGVRTILGRWRPLPDINARDGGRKQAAERVAINTPIQGSAADLIKVAMLRVYDELKRRGDDASLLLQVHDELVLEVKEELVSAIADMVCEIMESAMELSVPVRVDAGWGLNWLETK